MKMDDNGVLRDMTPAEQELLRAELPDEPSQEQRLSRLEQAVESLLSSPVGEFLKNFREGLT